MQGVVSERLTKGDHPRGVKVRLVDGRVGRVQRVVDGGADASSFAAAGGDGAGGGGEYGGREGSSSRGGRGRGRGGRGGFKHVLDIRSEDSYLYDEGSGSGPPDRGLGDYFAEVLERQLSLADGDAGSRRNDRGGGGGGDYDDDVDGGRSGDTVLATCPVCHVFEGDEMAVAFHVEREHFGGD